MRGGTWKTIHCRELQSSVLLVLSQYDTIIIFYILCTTYLPFNLFEHRDNIHIHIYFQTQRNSTNIFAYFYKYKKFYIFL